MFAIYNTRGRRFRDTLENLHKVQAPKATARMQLQTNISEDETVPVPTSSYREDAIVSSKALEAYRDIRNLNKREPIYHVHQIMSHPVITVSMDMNILAARRFSSSKIFIRCQS